MRRFFHVQTAINAMHLNRAQQRKPCWPRIFARRNNRTPVSSYVSLIGNSQRRSLARFKNRLFNKTLQRLNQPDDGRKVFSVPARRSFSCSAAKRIGPDAARLDVEIPRPSPVKLWAQTETKLALNGLIFQKGSFAEPLQRIGVGKRSALTAKRAKVPRPAELLPISLFAAMTETSTCPREERLFQISRETRPLPSMGRREPRNLHFFRDIEALQTA